MLEASVEEIEVPTKERRWLDWSALAGRTPPERTWRMAHWITSGPMYLGGRGGAGKTLLAQQLGTALAVAKPFIDTIGTSTNVLMWACEDDHDELWRRQQDICRWLSIDMTDLADLAGRFTLEPRLGLDNTLMAPVYGVPAWTPLLDELTEQVNDTAADMLIVDNISQTFGCNENARHDVTAFVNGLLGIRPGITVCLLGHPAKGKESEFSGSTAWENAVRMRWYLGSTLPDRPDSEADPNVRYIAKRKANYTAHDWRRLRYQDGVLHPEITASGTRYDSGHRREIARAVVMKALRAILDIGLEAAPSANSPDYLPRKITEMKFGEDLTRKELADAFNELLATGQIVVTSSRGSDRHHRKVVRPAEWCGK